MTAYDDLMTALRGLDDRGEQTPCQGPHRDRWISEDADDREAAARMCGPCPVLAQCKAAGDEIKASAAVYGGIPRGNAGRPRKTTEQKAS